MLNYRNMTLITGIVVLVLFLLHWQWAVSWYFMLIPLLVYIGSLVYGSIVIGAGFYVKSICQAAVSEKIIALSFDDGPADFTAQILDTLKTDAAEAAFFCIGKRIPGKEALLNRIKEEGHIIGNHSYTHHILFDLFSAPAMQQDLTEMNEEMETATGLRPRLFRPPYGVTNPNLKKAIQRGGYISVGWSIRSFDTVIKDEVKLLEKIRAALHPGAIVLFHDSCEITSRVLPLLLKELRVAGYRVVRLDKMLNLNPYA